MGAWPSVLEAQRIIDMGVVTATSNMTVITAGTANVKGSWVQLVASTSIDFATLIVVAGMQSTSSVLDLGIGAAASEVALIQNVMLRGTQAAGCVVHPFILPLSVPAGSRLAARSQSATASATVQVSVLGVGA